MCRLRRCQPGVSRRFSLRQAQEALEASWSMPCQQYVSPRRWRQQVLRAAQQLLVDAKQLLVDPAHLTTPTEMAWAQVDEGVKQLYRLDGIVTVVDARHILEHLQPPQPSPFQHY